MTNAPSPIRKTDDTARALRPPRAGLLNGGFAQADQLTGTDLA